jgi:hypothetical protein
MWVDVTGVKGLLQMLCDLFEVFTLCPDGCQILAGSRIQPASRQQVTVGVAYVSVTGIN